MKKYALIIAGTFFSLLITIASCTKTEDPLPCDDNGTICFENKMDSLLIITLKPINSLITLQRDYMECAVLPGNRPYTITIATQFTSRDTIIFVQPCDNKLLILR